MKKVLLVVVAALVCAAQTAGLLAMAGEAQAGKVTVTVTYKGKGTVDATHKLWVWLFDSPNIGAGSMPIDQIALDKNGAEAVFQGVSAGTVYVAVAFDESGAMDGQGPPPPGTPISLLMDAQGTPRGVTPGDKGIAAVTFDDTMRMQ